MTHAENQEIMTVDFLIKKMQEKDGKVFRCLQSIQRVIKQISGKMEMVKVKKQNTFTHNLDLITEQCQKIKEAVEEPVILSTENNTSYTIELIKKETMGTLKVRPTGKPEVIVLLTGKLFVIINILVNKQIEDAQKKSVPKELKGYVSRDSLEKTLYGKRVRKNRLNSHITRLRTRLIENGLIETNFIKSLEDKIRINPDKASYKLIEN